MRAAGKDIQCNRKYTRMNTNRKTSDSRPAEARAIAKEAYIYGFPLVDNCRVQYAYFVDRANPDYRMPWNVLCNIPRVFTPEDKAIQTPKSDTPYSWIGLDLRAEPIVFTVPPIEQTRYWSLQLIDLYTHNFDYLGTRTTGNDGGSFLVAGPNWKGETPKGIKKVIGCETEIASAQFRTQLFGPDDLDNVKKIQAQYIVKPLSAFLGQPAPQAAPAINFPRTPDARNTKDLARVLQPLELWPTVLSDPSVGERPHDAVSPRLASARGELSTQMN